MFKASIMAVTALTLMIGSANAVSLISKSSKTIVVEVYEWNSKEHCKDLDLAKLAKSFDGTWNKIKKAGAAVVHQMEKDVINTISSDGCDSTGKRTILEPYKSTHVAPGHLVVAWKDMSKVWSNPTPAIFVVPESGPHKGKDIFLKSNNCNIFGICTVDIGTTYEFR